MSRPKKTQDAKTGHYTKQKLNADSIAETAVDQKFKDGLDAIPEELTNADAIKVWKDWAKYLKDIGFYGNVNVPELIGYCNAWAVYAKYQRRLKRASLEETEKIAGQVKKWSEEMTRCMNRGGFSVSARINYGEVTAKNKMAEIDDKFGI